MLRILNNSKIVRIWILSLSRLGASNGFGNARSPNAILSVILTNVQANGKRFLSPVTSDRIFEEQSKEVDLVVRIPLRQGIGYGLTWSEVRLGSLTGKFASGEDGEDQS